MFNILTLNKISAAGLGHLGEKFTVSDDVKDPQGIILRSYKMHDMELPAGLYSIARAGAGVNNIPVDKCTEKGIVVFNTPGANANAVKELVLAGLLLSARKIVQGINWAQGLAGREDVPGLVEKGKADFGGTEIAGKTIGIVGIGGAIGLLVANACHALGMKVVGSDPFLGEKAISGLQPEIKAIKTDNPAEYLGLCDYISIHAPYTPATKHMFDAGILAKCKKGAVVINAARAELVDDNAMASALSSGGIGCYVTDFPNSSCLGNDKIIPIPHLGASTEEAEENCARMAAEQTREFLLRGSTINSVNFPGIKLDSPKTSRSVILYKGNADDTAGKKIREIVASRNVGFEYVSASKGGTGCAIVAYAIDSCNGACEIIKKLPEVLLARRINSNLVI